MQEGSTKTDHRESKTPQSNQSEPIGAQQRERKKKTSFACVGSIGIGWGAWMLIICRRLGGGIVVVRETGTAGRGRIISPASHARNVSGFVCGQSLSLCLSGQSGYLSRSLGPLFFFSLCFCVRSLATPDRCPQFKFGS